MEEELPLQPFLLEAYCAVISLNLVLTVVFLAFARGIPLQ